MSHADEYADAFSERNPKARKSHTCSACYETIPPGIKYWRYGSVFEGTADTFKHCARCRAIMRAIRDHGPRGPIDMQLECGESWEDVIGECPPEVQALAFMLPGEAPA